MRKRLMKRRAAQQREIFVRTKGKQLMPVGEIKIAKASPPLKAANSKDPSAAAWQCLLFYEGKPDHVGSAVGCGRCRKAFSSAKALIRHRRNVHRMAKPFVCEACHAAFKDGSHLREHLRGVHLRIREDACKRCGKFFAKRYLKKHIERYCRSVTVD